MNRFNKNIFHRTICIFLLLTLCTGLCFEATALPAILEVGESYHVGHGYFIQVLQTNLDEGKAWFELSKGGIRVNDEIGCEGESFNLCDGDVIHFDASICVIAENVVEMSNYNCRVIGTKTLAAGDDWEFGSGYSVRVVQIDHDGNKADFVLNKGGEVVDARDVSSGDWFSLDDGEIFHFDATLDVVFRGTDSNIVQLNPSSWRMLVEEHHPPGPPQNFQATPGDGCVDLKWSTPSDDGGAAITDYNIYRGTKPEGETLLTTVGTLTYTDNDVINDQTYYYQVRAVNSADEGEPSEIVEVTTTPGVTKPSAPQNLKSSPGDCEVTLEWGAPDDDGGAPVTGYKVYRGDTYGGGKTLWERVDNVLTYTDEGVTNDQTYYYHVSAVNIAGEGINSNEASATPEIPEIPEIPEKESIWPLIVALIAAAATIVAVIYNYRSSRHGSISASSNPDGARVFIDGVDKGESPVTLDKIRKGTHIVLFSESGYSNCEKRVVVNTDQITPVHCDLKKPEMKLRLSAEPTEIPADGKSKSVITIRMEDEEGTPAPVPEDTEIVLETNIGLIDTPARIPAGGVSATSILTSSTAGGTATVRAKSGTGLKNDVAVRFV